LRSKNESLSNSTTCLWEEIFAQKTLKGKASNATYPSDELRDAFYNVGVELEIAQGGVHRLETRVNGLYDSYQTVGSSRVEKRLRILTIVSAITLPFSLIAGLLGMNVGGLPATQDPQGLVIVIGLMVAIGVVELLYFKRKGWLD